MIFKSAAGQAAFMAAYDATLADWPVPYEAMRVPTRFGVTYVLASGPADGPPLVLLHAAGTGSTVWLHNVAAVSATYRTYLVDILGDPNRSEWSVPLRSRSDCADWLTDVLDGLQIVRTHLGGMSLGGWHSVNFALAAPDRVKSLMLFAPAACFAGFRPSFFAHFLFPMFFPTRARFRRLIQWLSATGQVPDERTPEQMFLAVKHYKFPKGGYFPSVFADEELRRLHLPILLLIGDHDVVYDPGRAFKRAMRLIPGIRAEMLPGAGHLLIMEQADLVNRRMAEFLASAEV